jgi:hypothetical protein
VRTMSTSAAAGVAQKSSAATAPRRSERAMRRPSQGRRTERKCA